MIYIVISFLVILFIGIFLVFKFTKKRGISPSKKAFFDKQLKKISTSSSPKEQIIDIDKLYHKVLQELGYEGTFGEILKQKPSEIGDINKVWELHKLRNKLVHEFDLLTVSILRKKSDEYKKILINLVSHGK